MWILLFIATLWCVAAFLMNRPRQSLLILVFLATGGFQLLPVHWFWSPLLLVKPYDYAFAAMGMIFLLRYRELGQAVKAHGVARLAAYYLGFLMLVLVASVTVYGYSPVQSIQSARIFFWPAFLLLFLMIDAAVLERFVRTLFPVVVVLSLLYLLQPITGKTIINPSGEYFNPYAGATETRRYLTLPDFLIFFLLLPYHRLCTYTGRAVGVRERQWLAFLLFFAVHVVSFTRSAILAAGLAVLYVSKRVLNPVLVALFVIVLVAGAVTAYSTSPMIENRVDDSVKDIAAMFDGRFLSRNAAKDGNLNFRIAHVNERLSYVLDRMTRWPMGAGFVHEESVAAQNLGFLIGLLNPFTGRVIQVDTGDIAWSVVIIKTGLGGLALMLAFLVAAFRAVGTADGAYAVVFRGALIYYLVTSFFSNNFVSPNLMLPLMLFLAVALRAQAAPAEERQPAARGRSARRMRSPMPAGRAAAAKLEQP